MRIFTFIAILCFVACSCEQSAQAQDGLTPEVIEGLFGDLSRPADVLLAEAEAKVAKAALGRRLTLYMELQEHLIERRAFKLVELLPRRGGTEVDRTEVAAEIEQLERTLKQAESEIRALSAKLASNWLIPVQTNIDDQQATRILQRAKVLVTFRSESGDVLEPVRLTLTATGVSAVGFAQLGPGACVACDVPPGEYQLVWQLTPKSIVQRVSQITIGEKGCVGYEVVLGMPEPRCTTKVADAIVLPHRSSSGPDNFSISVPLDISVPLYGNKARFGEDSKRELQPPDLIEGLEAPTP